jgi:aminoglycoside N3'-acetyltransferase
MGFKLAKDTPPMERELSYLLYDLCVKWGFCIPPIRAEEIRKMSRWSAEEFAVSVVEAEVMDPEYEQKWVGSIAEKFRERFGAEEISEATFVDRVRGHKESW